jgi:alginate O-acetyltransferase complex protein AlgI
MVFSSVTFLFYFLPAFLLVYCLLPCRNVTILVASIMFYAWGEARYLPLLLAYILLNYAFGLALPRRPSGVPILLWFGVAANLGMLFYFKYLGFVVGQIDAALTALALPPVPEVDVGLPLGISFFTFQGISYLIDVHRGDIRPQRNLLNFAMYKAMFPQLIAGPIVRYRQIQSKVTHRPISAYRVRTGLLLFFFGLGQKVLIADSVAVAADAIFGLPVPTLTTEIAWVGALSYMVQILFDFAGYSTMAIGLGHMMGFSFPQNFNRPYVSQSVTEFWRRWHMSLSSWFRDYLYIPLGGNRGGAGHTYFNLGVVFLLCGLWHGASWSFLAWGAYQGAFLMIERSFIGIALQRCWRPLRHAYLLLVVCFGWVLFRADTIGHAWGYMGAMFGGTQGDPAATPVARYLLPSGTAALAAAALICAIPWPNERALQYRLRDMLRAGAVVGSRQWVVSDGAVMIAVMLVAFGLGTVATFSLANGTYSPFIYFRF